MNRAYDEAMAIAELRAGTKDDLDALFAQYEKSTNTEDELAAIKEKSTLRNHNSIYMKR